MLDDELRRLDGVWNGTERVSDGVHEYNASGRLVFQVIFDGRFLLCDYAQTVPGRPTAFAHGVFRRDDQSKALTVTWFRTPAAAQSEQTVAVAEGDKAIFFETIDAGTTRTSYTVSYNRLVVRTERATGPDWMPVFEGTYRRR